MFHVKYYPALRVRWSIYFIHMNTQKQGDNSLSKLMEWVVTEFLLHRLGTSLATLTVNVT